MRTPLLLAFSGGLDTTYCVLYLQQEGYDVHTVTVDTGGFTKKELIEISEKATELGALSHTTIDAKDRLYTEMVSPLLQANYLKGGNYPACVGAERVITAIEVAELAMRKDIHHIGHGSTGAGNDQVRFDVALKAMMPQATIITPIRTQELSRQDSSDFLIKHGVAVDLKTTEYSVNIGILGTTIGGKETHGTEQNLPPEAFPHVQVPDSNSTETITITYQNGLPVTINDIANSGTKMLQQLNQIGAKAGFGAGHHIGTTILGLKGRIGFEAPGMQLLIFAKKELEKITLTSTQLFWKQTLGQLYGDMIHEGKYFDPLRRDLEAFLKSACTAVNGTVKVQIKNRAASVISMQSPQSLLDAQGGQYGESSSAWTGADAAGFCKLYGYEGVLAHSINPQQK